MSKLLSLKENISSKIYNFWQILRENLWFVPAIFCLVYFVITLGVYALEKHYFPELSLPNWIFSGTSEDAKSVILALFSSMITMATLAISITMVVLSLAATQLGPRLIRSFMNNRKTQNFIGLFFGAIVACFLMTLILYDLSADEKVPQLALSLVFTACFTNLFVLLAFVNHVAKSGIADKVILNVTNDLIDSLNRLTETENKNKTSLTAASKDKSWPKDFDSKKQTVCFKRFGYIQHINYEQIVKTAEEHGLYIKIAFKAGHFLLEGEKGVDVYTTVEKYSDKIEKAIRESFILGNKRTPTQDVEYSIRHLVEIGLRAQSPGVNDNFTAITVLDRLSSALAILFKKETPSEYYADGEGKIRLCAKRNDEADLIFSAFEQMRQSARQKPDIIFHLLKKLKVLCDLACTETQKQGLKHQLKQIEFDLKYMDTIVLDIEKLKLLCDELLKKLR